MLETRVQVNDNEEYDFLMCFLLVELFSEVPFNIFPAFNFVIFLILDSKNLGFIESNPLSDIEALTW